jgi:hypothetical protein
MLRLYWSAALLSLCTFLGPQNVYVSIVESGSLEDTKGALIDLKGELDKLGVGNRIILGEDAFQQIQILETTPEEGKRQGWIYTGIGIDGWEKRRIPHLAVLRNKAMEPLVEDDEKKWDRLLWINDVVFTVSHLHQGRDGHGVATTMSTSSPRWTMLMDGQNEDVATLLSTRDGNYAAACGLDFSKSANYYYDTFALRDSSGHETLSSTYPYFHSSASRSALSKLAPIPVKSCWNGIVAFDASPFYLHSAEPDSVYYNSHDPVSEAGRDPNAQPRAEGEISNEYALNPRSASSPSHSSLQFRAIPDSLAIYHVEGSECCLIHSDNPLRATKGIWMNPNVRVTFNESTYPLVNPNQPIPETVSLRAEAMSNMYSRSQGSEGSALRRGRWPGRDDLFWGLWESRISRWVAWLVILGKESDMSSRVEDWISDGKREGQNREELGRECLINEMQVLYKNGWAHR